MSISDLLGKKHSINRAEQTFKSMKAAADEGNLRLAVSRGITVIIQATAAAYKAPAPIIRKAEILIQATRDIIHGAVIRRAALEGFRPWRSRKVAQPKTEEEIELEKTIEEMEEDERTAKIHTKINELPFKVIKIPPAEPSKSHGAAEAGLFIPTPGDPYGYRLSTFMAQTFLVPPKSLKKITYEPGGINVYGAEASDAVLRAMTMLYKTFPWVRQSLLAPLVKQSPTGGSLMGMLISSRY